MISSIFRVLMFQQLLANKLYRLDDSKSWPWSGRVEVCIWSQTKLKNIINPVQSKNHTWPMAAWITHWRLCCPWRTLAFLPLLMPSLLTEIGITYTQLLQEEKIFPMMPRSEWSAKWSLRYAQKKLKKLSEKLRAKFPATTPGCSMLKIARLDDAFSEVF